MALLKLFFGFCVIFCSIEAFCVTCEESEVASSDVEMGVVGSSHSALVASSEYVEERVSAPSRGARRRLTRGDICVKLLPLIGCYVGIGVISFGALAAHSLGVI